MARLTDRVGLMQGEPVPVQLAGFFSNTRVLGQHGWNLALDETYADPYATRAVLHHEKLQLSLIGLLHGGQELRGRRMERGFGYGYTGDARMYDGSNFDRQARAWYHAQDEDGPRIELQCAGMRHTHVLQLPDLKPLSWRDSRTEYVEVATQRELHRLPLFAELHAARPQTQELIVEPADVQTLLDQILATQGPMRREIRARDKRRDAEGGAAAAPRQVHAQIVSLHAA